MYGIKQCPFCGGDAKIQHEYSFENKADIVFIECEKCGSRTKSVIEKEDIKVMKYDTLATEYAVKLWNERDKSNDER